MFIGTYEEYPDDLKDNEYLLTGYRCGCHDSKGCFKSLFMWHNETVNIWSHLLGAIGFIVLISTVVTKYRDMTVDGTQIINEFN